MKNKETRKFKPAWLVLAFVIIIAYIVTGAALPYVKYKSMYINSSGDYEYDNLSAGAGIDRVMLIESNQCALDERIRLMNMAEETIVLTTFNIDDCESTRDIASVLYKKAEEGVLVYIFCDGAGGVLNMTGNILFNALSAHPNILIKNYKPPNLLVPWKLMGRMHDKYVIVDDIGYIAGGRNTNNRFIGDYADDSMSYDREILVYNIEAGKPGTLMSSVWETRSYFETMWNRSESKPFGAGDIYGSRRSAEEIKTMLYERYAGLKTAKPGLFEDFDYIPVTYETDGIMFLTNPVTPYGKEPMLFCRLTDMMKKAETGVVMHFPYLVCNQYMYDSLAALHRDVPNSRIMINSVMSNDNFFTSSDYIMNKSDILNIGIPVYEYNGNNSYHGKTIVIDDYIAVIGSFNMSIRSAYIDTEIMFAVKSKDLVCELTEHMKKFEDNSLFVISDEDYTLPDYPGADEIPAGRKAVMNVTGLVLQAFHYLL